MSLDIRGLTEAAVYSIITGLNTAVSCYVSSSTDEQVHPAVLIKVSDNQEEIAPGTGIFRQRLEVELQQKLDKYASPAAASSELQSVRQCFYRNDTDSRPMRDLANRMTAAVSAYTCVGVLPRGEGPVQTDPEVRVYAYRLLFEVHATPTV
jgi:hypothetical protein